MAPVGAHQHRFLSVNLFLFGSLPLVIRLSYFSISKTIRLMLGAADFHLIATNHFSFII